MLITICTSIRLKITTNNLKYKTYYIQHLMMLSNRNKVSDFISEAERIIKKDKGKLPTVLVKFVTNHALYSMKGLTRTNKESILQIVFPE